MLAWLIAVAAAFPVMERANAPVGSDPVDQVFCRSRWAALGDVSVVEGAAPFGGDLLRADVDEVLVVNGTHTRVPAALLSEVDGTKVTPGRVLLLGYASEIVGGFTFHAIDPFGPHETWEGEDLLYPIQFSALPVGGVVEYWTTFELRDYRAVTITHLTTYDDLLSEIRRRAPRMLDARKRFKRCGFRKSYPERLPERGVRLDPPGPSALPLPIPPRGP